MSAAVRGLLGLVFLLLVCVAGATVLRVGIYGYALFVLAPVILGGGASLVFRPTTGTAAAGVGALALCAALGLLLLLRSEGLFCILMAVPLVVPLGALGGWFIYRVGRERVGPGSAAMLFLLPSAAITWDVRAKPEIFEVRSSVEIAASPEEVWKYVVRVPDLPEPEEWFFRAGVGYPRRSRLEGTGVRATRYCDFSTGSFVEPVEIWDEPRLFQFRITESPAPMRELNPFGEVTAKHLHGYFVSRRGQFRLTRLDNNHTLVEGTSWYQHGLWPAQYWRWWSDAIIHRIHGKVLTHIRELAEARR